MKPKQLRFGIYLYLIGWFCSGVTQAEPVIPPNYQNSPSNLVAQASTPIANWIQLRNVQVASDGLILQVSGNPRVAIQRIVSPDRLVVDLSNTFVPVQLRGTNVPINRYGIRQIRIGQFQQEPAIARIVLDLDPSDPNSRQSWQTSYNPNRGGLLLAPTGGIIGTQPPIGVTPTPTTPTTTPPIYTPTDNAGSAIIQSLIFTDAGKLVIQGNQPLNYRGSEDIPSGTYNISISPAQISPQLQRPNLPPNSPIERVRLTQVGSTVLIGIKTAPGWRLRETDHTTPQEIGLQLLQAGSNPTQLPDNSQITNRGRGVIVVDPGHGGPDVGAIGSGIYEKNITLPISSLLGQALQQLGYVVVYTRNTDVDIDLEPRVRIAQQVKADAFISIHANSLESRMSNISGVETYFSRGSLIGEQFARIVHAQIISSTGANDRGIKGAGFYVIKNTTMPAILVETGFVTNPQEAANLNNRAYQERMATAIARGIEQFLRSR